MLRSLAPVIALLAFAPAAQAASTYYAAPLTGNTTTCDVVNPCTLAAAVGKAGSGDTVQLASGEYHRAGGVEGPLSITSGITIEGQPGAPRPRVVQEDPYTGCDCGIFSEAANATFRHLVLDQSADTLAPGALGLSLGNTAEDILAIGGNRGGYAVGSGPAIQIRDSVFTGVAAGLDIERNAHLEHVTLVGTGTTAVGLQVVQNSSGTAAVTVDNSIVQGGSSGHDVTINTYDPSAAAIVTAHYSAISRSAGDSGGTGTEQSDFSDHDLAADPVFNAGGLGVTGNSPTIDAGSAALTTVLTDFDGLPRILGPAPDMGAFEYAPAPTATSSVSDVAQTTANLSGSVTSAIAGDAHFEFGLDTTYGATAGATALPGAAAPAAVGATLTGLTPGTTYHYRLVASNAHGTTVTPDASFTTTAASGPPPPPFADTTAPHLTKLKLRWPRLRFVLDEPARVTVTIGKRSWSRRVAAGAVTITAPRKVRRALKHGRHRLKIVAVDAAGNRGTVRTKRFRT